MSNKLDFRRDLTTGANTQQVAKWLGYARGGPQYHALATINQKEIRYSIFSDGPYWYLHISDGSFRHEVFDTRRDAIAFAQDDFAARWPT